MNWKKYGLILLLSISQFTYAELFENEELITVKRNTIIKPLFFASAIQPLTTVNVSSPSEGTIDKKNFAYGEYVEKDKVLFVIDSSAIEKDYHSALTDYLKSKEKFYADESKFKETKMLFDLGIVPRNEFDNVQRAFNNANVSYLQARHKLNSVMKAAQIDEDVITGLDISNVQAIDQALKVRYNCVKISALESGVALAVPRKSEESGKIGVGSAVKAGEVLALIGDMSGISLNIAVTEVDVREVKIGQKAIITGVAFPELKITGEVKHIDSQATSSHRSGLPLFPVEIVAENLTERERSILKVGMSAKIKLNVTLPGFLEVPIKAVTKRGQQPIVTKYVEGEKVEVAVSPGRTTPTTVEILEGLQEGDQIVLAH